MRSLPASSTSFLSTPSARRATQKGRRGRLRLQISIHALREEGDPRQHLAHDEAEISIHALREEGDRLLGRCQSAGIDFYPRPPRGGRLNSSRLLIKLPGFLSTPSARRATNLFGGLQAVQGISIHALREEGDSEPCMLRPRAPAISIHALREEGDLMS